MPPSWSWERPRPVAVPLGGSLAGGRGEDGGPTVSERHPGAPPRAAGRRRPRGRRDGAVVFRLPLPEPIRQREAHLLPQVSFDQARSVQEMGGGGEKEKLQAHQVQQHLLGALHARLLQAGVQ